jgi:hypothetical protein
MLHCNPPRTVAALGRGDTTENPGQKSQDVSGNNSKMFPNGLKAGNDSDPYVRTLPPRCRGWDSVPGGPAGSTWTARRRPPSGGCVGSGDTDFQGCANRKHLAGARDRRQQLDRSDCGAATGLCGTTHAARRAVQSIPSLSLSRSLLAAALTKLGRIEEAKAVGLQVLALDHSISANRFCAASQGRPDRAGRPSPP